MINEHEGTDASVPASANICVVTVQECNELAKLFGHAAQIMRDTLSRTASPNTDENGDNKTPRQALHESYGRVCQSTAEFERNATTLRTNSTALTLCRKLVSEDVPKLINTYDPFWEQVPPSEQVQEGFKNCVVDVRSTCKNLLKELDKIDVVASAKSYYYYTTTTSLGSRTLPDTEPKPFEKGQVREDVDACCAYLDCVSKELVSLGVKGGLEVLMKKQEYFRNSFMDFATIATFFSSITATTLQFSYANTDTSSAWSGVNICWFTSLVLSIASAANSFLGAIIYQSPEFLSGSGVHGGLFLHKWFALVPPVLLTISGVLFLIGICIFTFSRLPTDTTPGPSQGEAVQILTNSLTGLTFLTLLAIFMLAFTELHRLMTPFIVVFSLVTLAFLPALVIAPVLWLSRGKRPKLNECLFWNLGGRRLRRNIQDLFEDQWNELQDFFQSPTNPHPDKPEADTNNKTTAPVSA